MDRIGQCFFVDSRVYSTLRRSCTSGGCRLHAISCYGIYLADEKDPIWIASDNVSSMKFQGTFHRRSCTSVGCRLHGVSCYD